MQVTLSADKVWCNCTDFIQHRLPCKHLLSVAKKNLENFPVAYQQAIEFNCTEQLKGEYCVSVVDITESMRRRSEVEYADTTHPGFATDNDMCIAEADYIAAESNSAVDSCTAVDAQVTDPNSEPLGVMDCEDSEPGPSGVDLIPTRTEVVLQIMNKRYCFN